MCGSSGCTAGRAQVANTLPASQYQGRIIILAALMERLSYRINSQELPLTFAEFLRNAAIMKHSADPDEPWLIGDIGATNARCAIFYPGDEKPSQLQVCKNNQFDSLQQLLRNYVENVNPRPRRAALALAAPIVGNSVQMINCAWQFERDALAAELEFAELILVNDYYAVACGLPCLAHDMLAEIGQASTWYGWQSCGTGAREWPRHGSLDW